MMKFTYAYIFHLLVYSVNSACRNHPPDITLINSQVNNEMNEIKCFDGDGLIEHDFNPLLNEERWYNIINCNHNDEEENGGKLHLELYHNTPFPFNKFVNGCYPLTSDAFRRSLISPKNGQDVRLYNLIKKIILRINDDPIVIVTIGGRYQHDIVLFMEP